MLKKANIQWSGKTLCNQIEKGQLDFNFSLQRKLVWDLPRKSLLINSMIEGYPIPAFYFGRRGDKKYDVFDGKQRSNAIFGYMKDEYALSDDVPAVIDEEGFPHEIVGKRFSELPEWMQDAIKDYSLTIYYFEDITDDEKAELFYRINNGKALTSIELTRVKAKCIKQFQEIASHELISSSVSLAGKENRADENIAMQAWMLCFCGTKDFSTKVFRPCIEAADVTEEQMKEAGAAMDLVMSVCNSLDSSIKDDKRVLKKIKTRSHLVSSIYLALQFVKAGYSQDKFKETIYGFFNCSKTSISEDYNKSVGGGSARPEKVRARIVALDLLVK